MTASLERTAFTTKRLLEFFTEKELTMQIGHGPHVWPIALLKELIDNGLDACESTGTAPAITVTVESDSVSVEDNGPGLPVAILKKSLDYLVRVSDKNYYVSPTRGQLGNALKCVWAAPFVADGERGQIEVHTGPHRHQIQVTLDRIAQAPRLDLATHTNGVVKTGTFIKMYWPGIASYLVQGRTPSFYKKANSFQIVRDYALFNPHAAFSYAEPGHSKDYSPTLVEWRKWRPTDPTSPHWYDAEQLRGLIAANVSAERDGGRVKTVREFVSEFTGLSGSAKQKKVTDLAGLAGMYLHDLVKNDDIDRGPVAMLLEAMQAESRPIRPVNLGVIGEEHTTNWLADYCDPESVQYKQVTGEAGSLPFVLEVAFAYYTKDLEGCGLEVMTGLNFAPTLSIPFDNLYRHLGANRVDDTDPVMVVVHLACPKLNFTDRGKSRLELPTGIAEALEKAIKAVTKGHKAAKRQADKEDRLHEQQLEELRKARRQRVLSVKQAAFKVMEKAYLHASAGGTLPANARQIMYAARPLVLALTGGKCWKNSSYFTQHLLPDFIDLYPEKADSWDVVYDARGKLVEPHQQDRTGTRIDLGTLAVRRYVADWSDGAYALEANQGIALRHRVDTTGPANRYRFALFIEKEGFNELLDQARIADKYDIAIMSTKGMSVTAARQLAAELSREGVTILVLHDFDKAGFSIISTLRENTRRWQYDTPPNVIDLGLRLEDVRAMDLQSEPVEYDSNKNPQENLRESGATQAECEYLVRTGYPGRWLGERVELNAMTSAQFVTWLESRLQAAGVGKVIPDENTLRAAYRRALRQARIQAAINRAVEEYKDDWQESCPADLVDKVGRRIEGTPQAWDDAIYQLAQARGADE